MTSPATIARSSKHVVKLACMVQGDVFSLGVIMYEIFTMCPLATTVCMGSMRGDYRGYASKVATGHREPLDNSWPQALRETIAMCWHDCPELRPTAHDLVSMLSALEGKILYMDAYCPRKVVKAASQSVQHTKRSTASASWLQAVVAQLFQIV